MTKFNILSIDYYDDFKCIGNKCEDHCCKDWKITIDKKTYKMYKKLPANEFSKKLNSHINRNRQSKSDNHYAKIQLVDRKCPMFSEEGLCEVYLNLGEEKMCYTCRTYPRIYNRVDNTLEKSLTVSCIEVARNLLLRKNPISFNLVEVDSKDSDDLKNGITVVSSVYTNKDKNIAMQAFNEIRVFSIGLMQDRRFSVENRLAILGLFINKISTSCNTKEDIQVLIESYTNAIESGSYDNLLENLIKEDKLEAQLDLVMHIYGELMNKTITNARYANNFVNIVNTFKLTTVDSDIIKESYKEALNEHYNSFIKDHEYIYENYLVYYMFKTLFPSNNTSIMDAYIQLVVQFSILKLNLIGICGHYKEEMDEEKVLTLIQSYASITEHDNFVANKVVKYLKENNLNTLAHMLIIMGK